MAHLRKARVCFVTHYAYSLFNPRTEYRFGGAEVHMWLLGTGLANLPNYAVSFITLDHGQDLVEPHGAVKVYKDEGYDTPETSRYARYREEVLQAVCRVPTPPFLMLRRIYPSLLTKLPLVAAAWLLKQVLLQIRTRPAARIASYIIPARKFRTYDRVGADVYCVMGIHHVAAEVAAYCRSRNKVFVFLTGSDFDVSEGFLDAQSKKRIAKGIPGFLGNYVIHQADLIIAQTQYHAFVMKERFRARCSCHSQSNRFDTAATQPNSLFTAKKSRLGGKI